METAGDWNDSANIRCSFFIFEKVVFGLHMSNRIARELSIVAARSSVFSAPIEFEKVLGSLMFSRISVLHAEFNTKSRYGPEAHRGLELCSNLPERAGWVER